MKSRWVIAGWFALGLATSGAAAGDTGAIAHPVPAPPQLGSGAVSSAAPSPASAKPSQTERWLSIQREGTRASPHPQQATDAERELSYRRLLESYTHPIPEFFDEEAGGSFSR